MVFSLQHSHLFRTQFPQAGQNQATPPSKRPQFWGLEKKQNLGEKMLPKKMAQRKKSSFSSQLQNREEGAKKRSEWRSSLNSIVEGFNSLPKDEGNFTGQPAHKRKGRFDNTSAQ